MNLKDKLMEYDAETPLKIGAVDGNGFFYCGNVGEFLEKAEEYEKKGEATYINALERYRKQFDDLMLEKPMFPSASVRYWKMEFGEVLNKLHDIALDPDRGLPESNLLKYVSLFGSWARKTAGAVGRLRTAEQLLGEWKPYRDRDVNSSAFADGSEAVDTLIVKVTGRENGAYWLFEEAARKSHFKILGFKLRGDEMI